MVNLWGIRAPNMEVQPGTGAHNPHWIQPSMGRGQRRCPLMAKSWLGVCLLPRIQERKTEPVLTSRHPPGCHWCACPRWRGSSTDSPDAPFFLRIGNPHQHFRAWSREEENKQWQKSWPAPKQFLKPSPPTCQAPSWAVASLLFYCTRVVSPSILVFTPKRQLSRCQSAKAKPSQSTKAEQSPKHRDACPSQVRYITLLFSILFPPIFHK